MLLSTTRRSSHHHVSCFLKKTTSICGRQQQQQGMILSPLSSLQQRCSSSSASPSSSKNNQSFTDSSPNPSKTGAGIGNVENKMLPTADETKTFRHCQYPRTTSLIGAPMTYGQPFVGTDSGPQLLRERGLRNMLTSLGWRVEDLPDLDFETFDRSKLVGVVDPPGAKNCALVAHGAQLLSNVVEEKLRQGNFPLVLGGDHSIGIGSLSGILKVRPETGIIWVDAHADLNTPETSGSGNMHGMPVGLLMNHPTNSADFSKLPGFEFLMDVPRLNPDQIVYIGLRDVDPTERIWIRELGIKAFTMFDIDHYGIGRVMDKAFDHLFQKAPNRPLHLSYDIDAVDPQLAPATGTTVRGGLTYREAHFIAEAVANTQNLASADIVELNPTLSCGVGANETLELGLQIITSFMGKSII